MRKNQKIQLNKGDIIHCRDINDLYKNVRQLTVEKYDAIVDEKALIITIKGKFSKDGSKEE
jgi:tetrahydromethanopterin S-methyltransferase subunit A